MSIQPSLFPTVPSPARGVELDDDVLRLLALHAPVAIGVSGGKDSCALAFATVEHLDAIGHAGPRLLIHADLGRVEWKDSGPTCARLADRLGLELMTVRRPSGDMMDRWLSRWAANVERYQDLRCVKLILPWSTASMRFCTSELKTAVICRDLVRRWPGKPILSAIGIRRQESSGRRHAPTSKVATGLQHRGHRTSGRTWNAIAHWSLDDVLGGLKARGFELHEAYTRFGSTRVSCAFCILGSAHDLRASATCEDNAELYREMVALEAASTFAFQTDGKGGGWLGDVAPHLLTDELRDGLADAKRMAKVREAEEARLPEHLLYTKGWPTCMPTLDEADLIADVRLRVAAAVGIDGVRYLTGEAVRDRYEVLMLEAGLRRRMGVATADDESGGDDQLCA